MIVNVTVTQHHRRTSTQISRKPVVLGYIVAAMVLGRFGWFCWFCSWFWPILLVVFGGFGPFWVVLAGSVF